LIKKRIEKLEKQLGRGRLMVFLIEADGRIIHGGEEITQDEYEILKDKADDVVTIIDDLGEGDDF
jgi:hypothetical protein